MKLQASLIILVMVVSVAVLGWVYTMTSGGPAFQNRLVTEGRIQQASFYMDSAKTDSKTFGTMAMILALQENTLGGGINSYENNQMEDNRYWYCNAKNAPTIEEINYFLSMKTKDLVNGYIQNYNTNQENVGVREISPVTCVDYGITQQDIDSEVTDFTANFYGSDITVFTPTETTSDNDFEVTLTDIPYWEMYNNINDWLDDPGDTSFSAIMCNCLPLACDCTQGDCTRGKCKKFDECFYPEFDEAVENLEALFNTDDVTCTYSVDECYMEKGQTETTGENCDPTCQHWSDPPEEHQACYIPDANTIDCGTSLSAKDINLKTNVYSFALADGDQCTGKCWGPQEERMSMVINVICTDQRQYIAGNEIPLTYQFKMWIAEQSAGACGGGKFDCTWDSSGTQCACFTGNGPCDNCKIIGGGGGGPLIACQQKDCTNDPDFNYDCYKGKCVVDDEGPPPVVHCEAEFKPFCGCDPENPSNYCPIS